jgi:hypothetical protein
LRGGFQQAEGAAGIKLPAYRRSGAFFQKSDTRLSLSTGCVAIAGEFLTRAASLW